MPVDPNPQTPVMSVFICLSNVPCGVYIGGTLLALGFSLLFGAAVAVFGASKQNQ